MTEGLQELANFYRQSITEQKSKSRATLAINNYIKDLITEQNSNKEQGW